MSDPNLTPPPPDGEPTWTPPPAPPAAPAPPTGPPSSPPLPGQMGATPPPAAPGSFGAPSAPPGPPTPPTPPGVFGAPPPPGAPGQYPGAPQHYPAPAFPQQPLAQPYVPGAYGDRFVPELGVSIGSKGKRVGAKAIDLLIIIVVQFVIGFVIAIAIVGTSDDLSTGEFDTGLGGNLAAGLISAVLILAIDFVYSVVCTARFGGTPGKLALGLRVISQDGPPADMAIAFRRWTPSLALIVLGVIPIVGLFAGLARLGLLVANLVMVLVDERSRDVFDHVGHTYVIEKQ